MRTREGVGESEGGEGMVPGGGETEHCWRSYVWFEVEAGIGYRGAVRSEVQDRARVGAREEEHGARSLLSRGDREEETRGLTRV